MALKLVSDGDRMRDLLRPQNRIKHTAVHLFVPGVQGETLFNRYHELLHTDHPTGFCVR